MENIKIVYSSFIVSILSTYSHAILPVRITSAVVTGSGDGVCPSGDLIETQLNMTKQQVNENNLSHIY